MKKRILLSFVLSMILCVGCSNNTLKETEKKVSEETKSVSEQKNEDEVSQTISQTDSLESNFNELREEIEKNTEQVSLEYNDFMVDYFEETFFTVKNAKSISDIDGETAEKFLTAITFFCQKYDEGTIAKTVGEMSWDAIHSLFVDDGLFEQKMSEVKTTWEQSGFVLYETFYSEGQYKVGEDIPRGEYVVFSTDDLGYFSVTSDANGNDIIANENFSYNSIISIENGEYFELANCKAVPINLVTELSIEKSNMLKVGTHISPGEYKLIPNDENAYYCIYNDSRHSDIEANDIFETQTYVNVLEGQYLVLNNCTIEN